MKAAVGGEFDSARLSSSPFVHHVRRQRGAACSAAKKTRHRDGLSKEPAEMENVSSNATAPGTCKADVEAWYPRDLSYVAGVCCTLFVILGVPGNLLTLVSLGRSRRLRGPTTAFVLSLCCADLLFCAVNLPLTATRYFRRCWMFGDDMCVVFGFFFYGNVATSIFSMTGISVS
ncbi:hypothetical protein MTO96_044735, partial [Rhipicephalus appendiculatus]